MKRKSTETIKKAAAKLHKLFDESSVQNSDESIDDNVTPDVSSIRKSPRNQQQQRASTSKQPQRNQNNQQRNQSRQEQQQASSSNRPRQEQQQASSSNRPRQEQHQASNSNRGQSNHHSRKNKFPKHIREIMRLQASVANQIPKAPFSRLVKEILQSYGDLRMTFESLLALQDAAEIYFVQLFDDAYKLTLHRKRVTLQPSDISLVLYIRGQKDPGVK